MEVKPPEEVDVYEEVLVKAAEWDDKRAINFVVNQWQTRCLQKELEEEVLLRGHTKAGPLDPSERPIRPFSPYTQQTESWWDRFSTLWSLAFGQQDWHILIYIACLSIAQLLSILGFAVTVGIIIDDAATTTVDGKAGRVSSDLIGALAVFGVVSTCLVFGKTAMVKISASRFEVRLSETLMQVLSVRPVSWLTAQNPATAPFWLGPCLASVRDGFYAAQVEVVWAAGQVLCGLAGLAVGGSLEVLATGAAVAAAVVASEAAAQRWWLRPLHAAETAAATHRTSIGEELARQARDVRALGAERAELAHYAAVTSVAQARRERRIVAEAGRAGAATALLAGAVAAMAAAGRAPLEELQISVGGFVVAAAMGLFTLYYLQALVGHVQAIGEGMRSAMHFWGLLNLSALTMPLNDILHDAERRTMPTKLGELVQHWDDEGWQRKGVAPHFRTPTGGHVRFQNVNFVYPARPGYPVLRSLTLDVPAKQVLGLMGHSGSGRTTLASLLLRRMRPTGGVVSVDGVSVDDYDSSFGEQVAYLGAEPVVFEGTVLENIAYARISRGDGKLHAGVTPEDLITASKLADLHRFVSYLPQQYDTKLGTTGFKLARHALQRLVLARAFVLDAAVVVADDFVHTTLTAINARTLRNAVHRLLNYPRKRTGIVISQTAADFQDCDLLACVHGGMLREYGPLPDVVADEDSFYHRLLRAGTNPHEIDDGARINTPGDALHLYDDQEQQAIVADPVFNMTGGGALTFFKHPVAAGRHNQIYPQTCPEPDYV